MIKEKYSIEIKYSVTQNTLTIFNIKNKNFVKKYLKYHLKVNRPTEGETTINKTPNLTEIKVEPQTIFMMSGQEAFREFKIKEHVSYQ